MFVRVRVLASGNHIDVHESHFDPEKHARLPRFPVVRRPRRSKFRLHFQSSGRRSVEGVALSKSAGAEKEEVEP